MLNRKFASIRANGKTDKRASVTNNSNQRLSQSQSMDLKTSYQRNPNILLNLSKIASPRMSHERRTLDFDTSPSMTPTRTSINTLKSNQAHPYVNLLHQSPNNNFTPYQLQYQNSVPNLNPLIHDQINQSWNHQNPIQQVPIVTHYTAAQIYMRPKVNVNAQSHQTSPTVVNKKPPPPEVPKRLSSTGGSQSSLKKSNGLSRSSNLLFTII